MPGIDEELGRYLDSLVEPVEPEWVIGWVARRRRRRAAVVAVGAVMVAGVAGSIGYALHTPGPSGSVRFGTEVSSSTGETSSTSAESSSTTSTVPTSRPRTSGPSSSAPLPLDPHYPWPVKQLAAGDVNASLTFATDTFVAGASVDATVTLVNQTDQGVIIRDQPETDVAILVAGQQIAVCDPQLYWPAIPGAQGVLPPRETVTVTCPWVPPDSGPMAVSVGLQHMMVPFDSVFTETPVQIDVSPAPTTTTSSSPPETTTTT